MVTFEQLNEAERWIRPGVLRSLGGGALESTETRFKTTQDMVDVLQLSLPRDVLVLQGLDMDPEYTFQFIMQFTSEMLAKGLMDPAYAFAVKQLQFFPRCVSCLVILSESVH
jgi:hypothetical protein